MYVLHTRRRRYLPTKTVDELLKHIVTYFPILEHSALSAATAAKRYFPSGDGDLGENSGDINGADVNPV